MLQKSRVKNKLKTIFTEFYLVARQILSLFFTTKDANLVQIIKYPYKENGLQYDKTNHLFIKTFESFSKKRFKLAPIVEIEKIQLCLV